MNVARTNFGSAAYLRYETHSIFAAPSRFQFTNRQTRRVLRVLRSFAYGENFSDTYLSVSRYYTIHVTCVLGRSPFAYSSSLVFLAASEMRGGSALNANRPRAFAAVTLGGNCRRFSRPNILMRAHTANGRICSRIWSIRDGRAIFIL